MGQVKPALTRKKARELYGFWAGMQAKSLIEGEKAVGRTQVRQRG